MTCNVKNVMNVNETIKRDVAMNSWGLARRMLLRMQRSTCRKIRCSQHKETFHYATITNTNAVITSKSSIDALKTISLPFISLICCFCTLKGGAYDIQKPDPTPQSVLQVFQEHRQFE